MFKSIVILFGGIGNERSISIKSGEAVYKSLSKKFNVNFECLDSNNIPKWINKDDHIVFPMLHGKFGEDGEIQNILKLKDIEFAGSNEKSSSLCFNKFLAKSKARDNNIKTPKSLLINSNDIPLVKDIINQIGDYLVLKPVKSGSSIGLKFIDNKSCLEKELSNIDPGEWLIEKRLEGREFTIGVLGEKALGVIEIICINNKYDYNSKYNSDSTIFKDNIERDIEFQIQKQALRIYKACGCRDFARIDFILEGNSIYFLEINTLPGMTSNSLLPRSAKTLGYDFDDLTCEMISFAIDRFKLKF